jgi:hypothetical protein
MIKIGESEVELIRLGEKVVSAVYLGSRLAWQAIKSCFGSGYWVSTSPWSNDEAWKN